MTITQHAEPQGADAPRWFPAAAGAITLVMWASAFVVIRHVAHDISPGALGAGRLLVAALALVGAGRARSSRRGRGAAHPARVVLLTACGVGWFGIYNLALNEGERRVDAGTAAMIIQIGPIIVAFMAVWIFGEVLHRWLVIGMVIGFAGVAVIARGYSGGGEGDVVGVLLVVVAAAMYAVGVLSQKSLLRRRIPSVQVRPSWSFVQIGRPGVGRSPNDLVDVVGREGGSTPVVERSTWAFSPTGRRVHHVGLRAHPHRRRQALPDDLPGAGHHDADRLALARRGAAGPHLPRRGAGDRRGAAHPAYADAARAGSLGRRLGGGPGLEPAPERLEVARRLPARDPPLPLLADRRLEAEP